MPDRLRGPLLGGSVCSAAWAFRSITGRAINSGAGRCLASQPRPVLRQYSERPRFTYADVVTARDTQTAGALMTICTYRDRPCQRSHWQRYSDV